MYLEWVTQTVKDVRRSYDFLVQERNTDPDRVVLAGHSRAAVAALVAEGAEPRLAAVVEDWAVMFDWLRDTLER